MFKIVLITAIIMISFWGYGWYMGKVAPSVVDSTKVNKGEAVEVAFLSGVFIPPISICKTIVTYLN